MVAVNPSSGSREGLNPHDPGLWLVGEALRDVAAQHGAEQVLAVHCGPVPQLACPHVVLDVRQRLDRSGLSLADGLAFPATIEPRFGAAGVWPRAHLGKDFTIRSLAIAAMALRLDGELYCAVRKSKGSDSIETVLGQWFGTVATITKVRGYRLLRVRRTEAFAEQPARAALDTRYEISDSRLGSLVLNSAPGVFSRKALDAGTACLIDHVARTRNERGVPPHVLDLGAGIGPLTLWSGLRWPEARLVAIESNLIALDLLRENVRAAGLESRVDVIAADAWSRSDGTEVELARPVDLALVNPPTHADPESLRCFLAGIGERLAPKGEIMAVAARPGRTTQALQSAGLSVALHEYERYTVVEASRR